jgi:acyl-CoA thioesterase-1
VGDPAAEGSVDRRETLPTVVFLGDSLTAGLGLGEEEAYPALVGRALAERGAPARIVNAGVSGDTTAGGLARLDWLLTQNPAVVVVALGANDGLRAQPLATIESTLAEIVRRARAAGAAVVLAGMRMPPNYGPEYTRGFEAIYRDLARDEGLAFVPFLLEGVAADPELNQPDGIHPTAAGQRKIAELVLPVLEPLVREARAERAETAASRARQ